MEVSAGISTIRSPSHSVCPILEPICQILPKPSTLGANGRGSSRGICKPPSRNGSVSRSHVNQVDSSSPKCRCGLESLESLFCYDKPIPEDAIEEPSGIPLAAKEIGNKPGCILCEAKGVVLCSTCSGSGLYIDSILESQGILVKVRCLGCGGTGNTICSECGGRGFQVSSKSMKS
ncbi:uncharacterized protein LOC116246734 [Nymphaea colorata]|nr:uncharacterized protein LOC116246734 [Nymphaea colorata]